MATTCTDDGKKLNNKTSKTVQTKICYNLYRLWAQRDYQNKNGNIKQKWLQFIQWMDTNRPIRQAQKFKAKVSTTSTEDGQKQTTKTSTSL